MLEYFSYVPIYLSPHSILSLTTLRSGVILYTHCSYCIYSLFLYSVYSDTYTVYSQSTVTYATPL